MSHISIERIINQPQEYPSKKVKKGSLQYVLIICQKNIENNLIVSKKRMHNVLKYSYQNSLEYTIKKIENIYKQCLVKFRDIIRDSRKMLIYGGYLVMQDLDLFYRNFPMKSTDALSASEEATKLVKNSIETITRKLANMEHKYKADLNNIYKSCKQKIADKAQLTMISVIFH